MAACVSLVPCQTRNTLTLSPLSPSLLKPTAKQDVKAQASKAAKAVKKGSFTKERKPRYSVVFHRPKTLQRTRAPKFLRKRCVCVCGCSPSASHIVLRQHADRQQHAEEQQ